MRTASDIDIDNSNDRSKDRSENGSRVRSKNIDAVVVATNARTN